MRGHSCRVMRAGESNYREADSCGERLNCGERRAPGRIASGAMVFTGRKYGGTFLLQLGREPVVLVFAGVGDRSGGDSCDLHLILM
jgi:hypothetical protein